MTSRALNSLIPIPPAIRGQKILPIKEIAFDFVPMSGDASTIRYLFIDTRFPAQNYSIVPGETFQVYLDRVPETMPESAQRMLRGKLRVVDIVGSRIMASPLDVCFNASTSFLYPSPFSIAIPDYWGYRLSGNLVFENPGGMLMNGGGQVRFPPYSYRKTTFL